MLKKPGTQSFLITIEKLLLECKKYLLPTFQMIHSKIVGIANFGKACWLGHKIRPQIKKSNHFENIAFSFTVYYKNCIDSVNKYQFKIKK